VNEISSAPRFENVAVKSSRSIFETTTSSALAGAMITCAAVSSAFGVGGTGRPEAGTTRDGTAGFTATGFGFASSGKIRGAMAAQIQRNAIEITIAVKIRFSISGNRVPTSRIEDVAPRQPSHSQPAAAQNAVPF